MKKLYGSEIIDESEWEDNKSEEHFTHAYMAQKKYKKTANGKTYTTRRWQWEKGGKVCTHTSVNE